MHAVRWERPLIRGCPLLFLLALGVPLLPLGHAMRWELTLLLGGVPPFVWAWPTRLGRARSVPCPLLPACSLCAMLGMGGPFLVLGRVARGGPMLV